MSIYQESMDLTSGRNLQPNALRYRLPDTHSNSVFLVSNSFEYDVELIRNIPSPKTSYRGIIIPYSQQMKLLTKDFKYQIDKNNVVKKVEYMKSAQVVLKPMVTRKSVDEKANLFISASDVLAKFNVFMKGLNLEYIRDHVEDLMVHFLDMVGVCPKNTNRIVVIDTTRYPLIKKANMNTYNTDLVNAFLTACILTRERIEKQALNITFLFKTSRADYRMSMDTFNGAHDVPNLQAMLRSIGTLNIQGDTSDEEITEEAYIDESDKPIESDEVDLSEKMDELEDKTVDAEDITKYQFSSKSPYTSINATINQIMSNADKKSIQRQPTPTDKLNQAKQFEINAKLLSKIVPAEAIVDNYKSISADLKKAGDNPVENRMMDNAAKLLSGSMKAIDTKSSLSTITSPREYQIRSILGKIELENQSIDSLNSIVDVPLPERTRPNNITSTNPGVQKGTGFTKIEQEYEDKMMDRDIVATFMHLADLPYGFTVKDIEVTDISTVTSLMYNWKIILDNKKSGRRSTLNIRVPKMINGKFYNNGIWNSIGKQDFPIPVLKTDKRTVMITSNYNKMTIERYDTKTLVDITALVKVVKTADKPDGTNPYVKPGSSVATNARYASTVEFDEYAKQWLSFVNKEADCQILFNRMQCTRAFEFVTVKEDEFCCGMINKVPVVVNINTGLTREGKSLTDTMLDTLGGDLHTKYVTMKPGKTAMYAQMRVLATNMPAGVVLCAWEGISKVLQKAHVDYQFVDKKFRDANYFTIPFSDKSLAVKNTIQNQLLLNGFYRISTKGHAYDEFDEPITEANSIYVDIFNDLFFKKFSDLTAFITTYHFFMDEITKDVCAHFHIPTDIVSCVIYAINLLADNSHMNEGHSSLYRVRSSEIIPAIIHYHLAMAISKYNNTIGSKTRTNTLVMNPNEVLNELLEVNTVGPISALNPSIELHDREVITNKGFMGLNVDRSYTRERRSFNPSMIGKMALSSPNSANVGINRQLVCDPKLESVRGYTSMDSVDSNFNDLQLSSFSELLTPGSISRDDAIRTAIATSQTGHIVSTEDAQPVMIANGVDEIVPSYLSDEFAYVAKEDGKVLEITDEYIIIQYTKSKKKEAIHIGSKYSFNSGSGFYVDNKLSINVKPNASFKQNDILAYHEKYFSKDSDGIVRMNLGPIAKIAFAGSYFTYEDAGLITHKMSKRLGTKLTMMESVKIDATADIDKIVQVGDEVEIGDPLVVFGLGDTGDKSVDNFLKAFQTDSLDTAKRKIVAKHAGTVVDVRIYTNKSMDKLSPSLYKIISQHFKDNKKRRQILDNHDSSNNPYKLNTLYARPTEPLKGNTIKGITCDVFVEIYIEHADDVSIGDKVALYGPNKQIISDVVPEGLEPYAESRPDEEISMFGAPVSIMKRMIPSVVITAAGNKVLIETKRKIKAIWENDNKN